MVKENCRTLHLITRFFEQRQGRERVTYELDSKRHVMLAKIIKIVNPDLKWNWDNTDFAESESRFKTLAKLNLDLIEAGAIITDGDDEE